MGSLAAAGQRPETPRPFPTELAWSVTLPAPPSAAAALDEQRLYVPLQNATVVALDRQTGALSWTAPLDSALAPVITKGRLVVGASDALVVLDPATGAARLRVAVDRAPSVAPVIVGDGMLLMNDGAATLFSRDGAPMWRQEFSYPPVSAVVSEAGSAFVALEDSRVVALDGATGRILWEQQLAGELSAPASARDRLFVGSTDNHLYALDADDGTLRWRWRAGADVIGAVASSDTVVFVSLDNLVRASSRSTGNQRWRQSLQGRPAFAPVLLGGRVVISDLSPSVSVLDLATGTPIGTLAAPGDLAGPPLLEGYETANGTALAMVTRDGRAFGFRAASAPPNASPPSSPGSGPNEVSLDESPRP